MAEVLYRKYRPQNFAAVIGQDLIVKILRSAVQNEQVAHAYLFTGPRGTGKTSTARIFAKAINCQNPEGGDACDKCANCMAIQEGEFLDIIEIDAASNRGVNEIRELKERVAFAPAQGKFKIYIIDEVHMLTKEAFNALLKTLEEPPKQVVFILATTEVQKMPVTILSRVVRLDFKLASNQEMLDKLTKICDAEEVELAPGALDQLIRLARGSYRDAESLLEKVLQAERSMEKSSKKGKLTISEIEVATDLGINLEQNLIVILALFAESKGEPSAKQVLALQAKLQEVFQGGLNAQHFLTDFLELLSELILASYGADVQRKLEGLQLSKKQLFRLVQAVQELLNNYPKYLDPHTMIRLKLLEVFLPTTEILADLGTKLPQTTPPAIKEEESEKQLLEKPSAQKESIVEQKIEKHVSKTLREANKEIAQVSSISLEEFTPKFFELVTTVDIKLSGVLKQSNLVLQSNTLFVRVPSKFHLNILNQPKTRQLLQTSIAKLLGEEVQLQILQGEKTTSTPVTPNQQADNTELVENLFSDML